VNTSTDYASVGNRILVVSELLCDAVDVRAGERVLDVATGTGNAALAAARRFADVVGIDYVPDLLDRARLRAEAENLDVNFRTGDAEALEFDDGTFDVVLSACGAMFAPDHRRTASELLRVCRPGGRIGMVNWCPDGYVGALFRAIAAHVPPPPGVEPPGRWGEETYLRDLWGDAATVVAPRKTFLFRFPSPSTTSSSSPATTDRPSRRSKPSATRAARPRRRRSSKRCAASTAPTTAPSSCRWTTSRSLPASADPG